MTASEFISNTATQFGGAFYLAANATINGGLFQNNHATVFSGGASTRSPT